MWYKLAMATEWCGRFCFYELRTTDRAAATDFDGAVWGSESIAAGREDAHLWVRFDGENVGEITVLPPQAVAKGAPAHWLGHLGVSDVELGVQRWESLGGSQLGPRRQTADGYQIALIRDPFESVVALTNREGSADPRGVLWHELHTQDQERAVSGYGQAVGIVKTEAFDPGLGIGLYQQFAWQDSPSSVGAMVSSVRIPGVHPHWLYYFKVPDLMRAIERTESLGGRVYQGVRVLPSGARVAQCEDPQGAVFGLLQSP